MYMYVQVTLYHIHNNKVYMFFAWPICTHGIIYDGVIGM